LQQQHADTLIGPASALSPHALSKGKYAACRWRVPVAGGRADVGRL